MFSLAGKVAVVSGGSRGLGRAMCLGLAEAGATVVSLSRNLAAVAAVADEIAAAGGRALPLAADVTDAAAVQQAMQRVTEAFGRVDVLVNNAGSVPYYGRVERMTLAQWNETLAGNLTGAFLLSTAAAPSMFANGGGSIINVSSIDGLVGVSRMAAYCAAKAGVVGLTRALAAEWADRNVRVNCICPGPFATEMTAEVRNHPEKGMYPYIMARTPLGRFARPEEAVGAVLYFASPASTFTTGSVLSVDGGFTAL